MLSDLLYRLRALFRRKSVEAETDAELRGHLERQTEKYLRSGLPPEEAARRARLDFGGFEKAAEECRDARGMGFMETTIQDFRFGFRALGKTPLFTAVAAITLALGIGSTTAMFSMVDAVLLQGTPYRNPARLFSIGTRDAQGHEELVTPGDFIDWKAHSKVFDGLAAYKSWEFHALTGAGEPDEVWASAVSTNAFQLLGVRAAAGRTFAANETQTLILSHEYWRSHFAADPKIIGKTLALDGKPYTVIGIAASNLQFPDPNTLMWIPLTFSAADEADHEHQSLNVIARLKDGVSLDQAQAGMNVIARQLALEYPATNTGRRAFVTLFKDREAGSVLRSAVFALLGAVVLVFAIVCANTTSMLLARGSMRQAELAIRAALGAGRSRLVRQMVAESVLLAGAGSLGGLGLGRWGLTLIVSSVPKFNLIETQAVHRISINLPALGFTVAFAFLTGIAVGLVPAWRATNLDLNRSLKQSGWPSRSRARRSSFERGLIISEVALALVLLVGAGLMIQTFMRLESAPTGFRTDHLLTVRVPLVNYKYSQGEPSAAFYRSVLERIEAIPGVKSAAMANNLPFTGFHTSVYLPASPSSSGGTEQTIGAAERSISPEYFRAMGIPVKAGREFTEADNRKEAPCVLIVNESMARLYWPGENPVGKLVPEACPKHVSALVVGMVADSKQNSVDASPQPEIYSPYAQFPFASFLVTFVIRTSANPADLAPAVRRAVWEVDRDQPVIQMRPMIEVISESIWQRHVSASMLGIFAGIALVLASIGIYGALSYSVSRRTHEIGIRMALGARQDDVLWAVVGEGFVLALFGIVSGTAGALALTKFLKSLLFGVRPADPRTFVAVALILVAVALFACYIPARRASRVDPMLALRCE
jgi:putative ABC transport system permease protein